MRTTHLTGITTDLGIGMVRVFSTKQDVNIKTHETRANWVRIGLIGCFALGSTAAAFLFYHFQYLGFLGPALISLILMSVSIAQRKKISQISAGVNDVRSA